MFPKTGQIAPLAGTLITQAYTGPPVRRRSPRGGHLLEAHVWPTLEVILVEPPAHLCRRMDPESGLALIDLDAAVEHPTVAERRV